MNGKIAREIRRYVDSIMPNADPDRKKKIINKIKKKYKETPKDKRNRVVID